MRMPDICLTDPVPRHLKPVNALLYLLIPAVLCVHISVNAQDSHSEQTSQRTGWSADLYADHSLTGQIWSAPDNRFISREELTAMLSEADVLLLGEKHDNPDHHRLRHELLQGLISGDKQSLLVMEMLTQTQQPAVDALRDSVPLPAAEDWPQLLSWDEAWTWEFYRPAIDLALRTNTRLMAGNIGTERLMQIYRAEAPARAEIVLDAQQLAKLADEIDISHCGMLPESQIPPMVRVQQARDQQMADALLSPGEFGRRILLAGNYHIRYDLSVPNYLRSADAVRNPAGPLQNATDMRILNLAFLEVNPALTAPSAYIQDAEGQPVYDFIWFTPALRSDDYCADMAP